MLRVKGFKPDHRQPPIDPALERRCRHLAEWLKHFGMRLRIAVTAEHAIEAFLLFPRSSDDDDTIVYSEAKTVERTEILLGSEYGTMKETVADVEREAAKDAVPGISGGRARRCGEVAERLKAAVC